MMSLSLLLSVSWDLLIGGTVDVTSLLLQFSDMISGRLLNDSLTLEALKSSQIINFR